MEKFSKLIPEDLYHSYVIEGDPNSLILDLKKFLEERGDVDHRTTDVFYKFYEAFTILDSEIVHEWYSKKRISEKKKVCIIGANFLNNEAEKSLLKILEEPFLNTHFFIITPNISILKDTILSRVHTIRIDSEMDISKIIQVEDFVKMDYKDRLDFIAKIIKDNSENEGSGKIRHQAIEFLNNLENFFYKKFEAKKDDENLKNILREINKNRDYLNSSGSSVKMILEYIALII